jgi:hypothetical protein
MKKTTNGQTAGLEISVRFNDFFLLFSLRVQRKTHPLDYNGSHAA